MDRRMSAAYGEISRVLVGARRRRVRVVVLAALTFGLAGFDDPVAAAPLLCAFALRASPACVFGALLKPVMLGASTRNSLICVPLALETLKNDLNVKKELCDLYVPIGIATIRFGTILYFVIATLFLGILMGRHFGFVDLVLLAIFSVGASFATLGVSGLAALAPLARNTPPSEASRPAGATFRWAPPS